MILSDPFSLCFQDNLFSTLFSPTEAAAVSRFSQGNAVHDKHSGGGA